MQKKLTGSIHDLEGAIENIHDKLQRLKIHDYDIEQLQCKKASIEGMTRLDRSCWELYATKETVSGIVAS